MFSRKMLLSALISTSLSLIVTSAMAYNIGDVVEIQPSMMNNPAMGIFYRGKVSAITADGRFKVMADDGTEYLISNDPRWIRAASGSFKRPAGTASGASASSGISTRGNGISTLGNSFSTKSNTISTKTNSSQGSASTGLAAKGSPPDGEYNCMKISSGSLIHLGTLEIRGGTYRGLDKTGAFHPMVMSGGGNITWSQGFRGFPEGWKLGESKYVGGDSQGRPLIRIYYRSGSGWNEMMDALKEK